MLFLYELTYILNIVYRKMRDFLCDLVRVFSEVLSCRYAVFVEPQKYQLRAYIYQARDLLAGDSNGLSGKEFPFSSSSSSSSSFSPHLLLNGDLLTNTGGEQSLVLSLHTYFATKEFFGTLVTEKLMSYYNNCNLELSFLNICVIDRHIIWERMPTIYLNN